MIETIKRLRLQRKGLSCGKKRRERDISRLRHFFQSSPVVMGLLLAACAAFLGWLVLAHPLLGAMMTDEPMKAIALMLIMFVGGVLYYSIGQPEAFLRNSRVLLVFGGLCLHMGLVKVVLGELEARTMLGDVRMLILPYALAPLAVTVLLGRWHGVFVTFFATLWGCFLVAESRLFLWVVISLVSGLATVIMAAQVRRRQHVLRAGLVAGLAVFGLALVFGYIRGVSPFGSVPESWPQLGFDALCVVGAGLATGMVVTSVLPIIEHAFRITTSTTWLELADLNHPLLKRLTLEAPGTYHHSLMVANLAEAAAEAIGAQPLLTRVCSYFHDIGKLKNPEYFIENQPHDANPHDRMKPSISALVVTSHVKDGIDLAMKSKLNDEILDIIEQHHGTSLAFFFYKRALAHRDEMQAQADAGQIPETDVPDVQESAFRYQGPLPQSRESGIISLADAIESASRSLEKPTPQRIEQLVADIVRNRIIDGQLDETDLTMAEIGAVQRSFVTSLRSMLHKRVSYQSDATSHGEKTDRAEKGDRASVTADPPTQRIRLAPRFEVVRGGLPTEVKPTQSAPAEGPGLPPAETADSPSASDEGSPKKSRRASGPRVA
jgi:cyclic-di-AMP phosphodiesterase PgpH